MRKTTAEIVAAVLLLGLMAGCARGTGTGSASPGNIVTPPPLVIHDSTQRTDVSAEYQVRLTAYPWMDVLTMDYYSLQEDGSMTRFHVDEAGQRETVGEGAWTMFRDAEGYLTLRIEEDGAEPFEMYNLEYYDTGSIYAVAPGDVTYMWLRYTE